jgi:hypothetical protein
MSAHLVVLATGISSRSVTTSRVISSAAERPNNLPSFDLRLPACEPTATAWQET